MKAHLQYLAYVLRHKWFVFQEGRKLGVPLWQLIIHDWHKFLPAEWGPYVDHFYRKFPKWEDVPMYHKWHIGEKWTAEWAQERFDRAWLHHIHLGKHHPQHWVLRQDDGSVKCLEMPWNYRLEMLADWRGAGRAQGKGDNTADWYVEKGYKHPMHPNTRIWVESVLGAAGGEDDTTE